MSAAMNPVLRLYEVLCGLDGRGAEGVDLNLSALDSYSGLSGERAPKFLEWAHTALATRTLVTALSGKVLRLSDIGVFIDRVGARTRVRSEAGGADALRTALRTLGVREPEDPPPVQDGLQQIHRFLQFSENRLAGRDPGDVDPYHHPDAGSCRGGLERFMKLEVRFLMDIGLQDLMVEVYANNLHDFKRRYEMDLDHWLDTKAESGGLNYYLSACSARAQELERRPRYLGKEQELWRKDVCSAVTGLSNELNKAVHDNPTPWQEQTVGQIRACKKLMNALSKGQTYAIPKAIQFFSRREDSHGIHYDGYAEGGRHVVLFDVGAEANWTLHEPYLFAAATNPCAVDASVCPLRKEFLPQVIALTREAS